MGIRRGAAYLESLRDGRKVWLRGERVDPVTHQPRGVRRRFRQHLRLAPRPGLPGRAHHAVPRHRRPRERWLPAAAQL